MCTDEDICAESTCEDGVQNGNETDVDCGGGDCPGCNTGETCVDDADCASFECKEAACFDIDDNPNSDAGAVADGEEQPGDTASGDGDTATIGEDTATVDGGGIGADVQFEAPVEPPSGCSCRAARPNQPIPKGGVLVTLLLLGLYMAHRRRERAGAE